MLTIIQHCRSAQGSAGSREISGTASGAGGVGVVATVTNMCSNMYDSVLGVFSSSAHIPVPLAQESPRDTTNPVAMFTIEEDETEVIIDSEDNCEVSSGVGSGVYTVVSNGSVKNESVSATGNSENATGGVSQEALFLIVTVRLCVIFALLCMS